MASGEDEVSVYFAIANDTAINTTALAGAIYVPEETRAVLTIPEDLEEYCFWMGVGDISLVNDKYEESGLVRFAAIVGASDNPFSIAGKRLFEGIFNIADEETVIETAEAYDIELQYDEAEGYYYAFPITLAERDGSSTAYSCKSDTATLMGDVDLDDAITYNDVVFMWAYVAGSVDFVKQQLYNADCYFDGDGNVDGSDALELLKFMVGSLDAFSGDDSYEPVEVSVPYFSYLDPSAGKFAAVDIMNQVDLIDGEVRITVSDPYAETTTTTEETTTTTEETTTTTEITTEEVTTTASNDCAVTLSDPYLGNLYVGNTFDLSYTTADDYTGGIAWLSNDSSVATVTQDVTVTITGEGTVTIRVMDDNGFTSSITFTTFTLATSTEKVTTTTEETTTKTTTEEVTTTEETTTTTTATEETTTTTTTALTLRQPRQQLQLPPPKKLPQNLPQQAQRQQTPRQRQRPRPPRELPPPTRRHRARRPVRPRRAMASFRQQATAAAIA
ncbi:MAG: hypothetical protein LUC50_00340 [Ruminococcus sp.]|nr:hypothetical protein [Ruminococcus sp.]